MPASALTDTAALTSGFGIDFSAPPTTTKPGSAAITPPKPYSEAVFIEASSAPPIAAFVPVAKRWRTRLNAVKTTSRMPAMSAPSTDHTATTVLIVADSGVCTPGSTALSVSSCSRNFVSSGALRYASSRSANAAASPLACMTS